MSVIDIEIRRSKRTAGKTEQPFTLPHFRRWAKRLILDNGQPWVPDPFQEAFVQDLFEGRAENWLVIPEGNGKTTLLAGIALYHCEHRQRAYVAIAASTVNQTRTLYRQAEGFVTRSPELHDTFEPYSGFIEIRCALSEGLIKIWSADPVSGDGIIPTLCLIEEAHRHKDLTLYRLWRGKLGKRTDGVNQIALISTAGEPYSDFEETRAAMRQQADKVERYQTFGRYVSESFVLHEWAVPEDGDTENLELVTKANPLLTLKDIKAKRASPTWNGPHWNRMVCGRATRAESAAIQEAEWQAAQTDERIPVGEPIWLGLDVGWKTDTTAFAPLYKTGTEHLLGPATVLTAPPTGESLHPDEIKAAFRQIQARNPVAMVVMDVFGARDIAAWIENEGIQLQEHSQADAQAAIDYERFMEGLRNHTLRHMGDKLLTRHAMAAAARLMPSGKVRFGRISRERIAQHRVQVNDALIAAAMVNAAASSGVDEEIWVGSA
jgi:phage terminase large subunit-like protein